MPDNFEEVSLASKDFHVNTFKSNPKPRSHAVSLNKYYFNISDPEE